MELSQEICTQAGRKLDKEAFDLALQKAKKQSRQASSKMFDKGIDWSTYLQSIPETKFL
ncbi:MAG: hypothetical protein GXP45_04095 [bacterium]|nr:hypothetical protein [bacterium]